MSLESDIKTVLSANSTLASAFTGGIITYSGDTGSKGLTRNSYSAAFDTNTLRLKPTILIHVRSEYADNRIADAITKDRSAIRGIQIDFYQDSAQGFTALETGKALVRDLLDMERVGGGIIHYRDGVDNKRDRPMENASLLSATFDWYGVL